MSENSIPGESCACAGAILAVDKEHNKCGKMTCFVEELTMSPGASWQSSSEILRSSQRGHMWRLRWAEDRSLQLAPLPAACRRPPAWVLRWLSQLSALLRKRAHGAKSAQSGRSACVPQTAASSPWL